MIDDPVNYLSTLDWRARAMIKRLAKDYARKTKKNLRIRSGRRTCAEQNALFAQGGTVTGAKGCKSWHVTGRAVDLDPIDPRTGEVFPGNSDEYRTLGALWKKLGGIWGGDFSNIYDPGHFEWHPGSVIEDVCPDTLPCENLRVQKSVPTYLIISGAILTVTVGIFAATAFGPSASRS